MIVKNILRFKTFFEKITYRGGAPSRNGHESASSRSGSLSRQSGCLDVGGEGESGADLPDRNVIQEGGTVKCVVGDFGNGVDGASSAFRKFQFASNNTVGGRGNR
jgi:hypothetical protein